jgi:hypothetical protein
MFLLPPGDGNAGEGESDAKPIRLPSAVTEPAFTFIINTLFGRYVSLYSLAYSY